MPGLDKCFTEKSDYDNDKFKERKDKNMNENAVKFGETDIGQSQKNNMKVQVTGTTDVDRKETKTEIGKTETDSKIDKRPKSLERDARKSDDVNVDAEAKRQDDSSPDSEYQSGKENFASESDSTNDAPTPGSEVESSVDTGEVFTNNDAVDTENGKTDVDKAAENCVIS